MSLDLKPEPMYTPLGGMNPDSNGITLRPQECIDALNVNMTVANVKIRAGTRILTVPELALTIDATGGEILAANVNYTLDVDGEDLPVLDGNGFAVYHETAADLYTITYDATALLWLFIDSGTLERIYTNTDTGTYPPTHEWIVAATQLPSTLVLTDPFDTALP